MLHKLVLKGKNGFNGMEQLELTLFRLTSSSSPPSLIQYLVGFLIMKKNVRQRTHGVYISEMSSEKPYNWSVRDSVLHEQRGLKKKRM